MIRLTTTLVVLVLVGCGAQPHGTPWLRDTGLDDAGAGRDAGPTGGLDAGFDPGAGADAGCLPELPLTVTLESLGPTRAYAHVNLNGADVALLVDTGSQHTFLTIDGGPDGRPAGTIGLGCEQRAVIGRPFRIDEAAAAGRPVVGILGADWFLERQRELDLPAHTVRTVSGPPPQGWASLPYENHFGYLFVRVKLDGADVRLGFDTGAPHSLWLGQPGQPGDQPVATQDAYGNPLTLYLGTATLTEPRRAARTVPMLRVVSFPSLEDSNELLGGNIHGLYGLTSMGHRKLRIDAAASSIWLEP